ncbi:MAG: 16S rRNA (cytosine(1402)-N(4))-methyltransferase RsmH [Planctomycetota bacterium]
MTLPHTPDSLSTPVPPQPPHASVLLKEALATLNPQPGQCAVDATLGAGGHSAALIERLGPGGILVGIDADTSAIAIARARLEPLAEKFSVTLHLVHSNFSRLPAILHDLNVPPPNAILADIGVSSMQFDDMSRGFSFRADEPLDMRMDRSQPRTAADILREADAEEIADILFQYGDEHKSRRIARAIVEIRETNPVDTTGKLAELVRKALRLPGHRRVHPATKTFQALRIAVNRELDVLDDLLRDAPELLATDGTFAVIAFHSLEDRRVKLAFKALSATCRFNQGEKFVRPGAEEEESNPRSRSAIMRAIQKTASQRKGQKYAKERDDSEDED